MPPQTRDHADIRRPTDRRMRITQLTRLVDLADLRRRHDSFAETHLNERGSRTRSPRLIRACALFVLSGESFDFVEAIARPGSLGVAGPAALPTLIARAQELVEKKEGFTL